MLELWLWLFLPIEIFYNFTNSKWPSQLTYTLWSASCNMASGGHSSKNPKTSASEPRQRRSWQRTTSASDKDDNVSQKSFPNDLKQNNWLFLWLETIWQAGSNQAKEERKPKQRRYCLVHRVWHYNKSI